ncbi:MAG: 30S ribosomal protein S17 [Thermoproteota archaeon]|nr:30S ribosomal protein S17 [Thermoproteota archaeon]
MTKNIGIQVNSPKRTCTNKICPFCGSLSLRGKLVTGTIVSHKAKNMVVVEREYSRFVSKYKRYERSQSRIHAFISDCIDAREGNKVKIAECRPLSKTISFAVVEVSE